MDSPLVSRPRMRRQLGDDLVPPSSILPPMVGEEDTPTGRDIAESKRGRRRDNPSFSANLLPSLPQDVQGGAGAEPFELFVAHGVGELDRVVGGVGVVYDGGDGRAWGEVR